MIAGQSPKKHNALAYSTLFLSRMYYVVQEDTLIFIGIGYPSMEELSMPIYFPLVRTS